MGGSILRFRCGRRRTRCVLSYLTVVEMPDMRRLDVRGGLARFLNTRPRRRNNYRAPEEYYATLT